MEKRSRRKDLYHNYLNSPEWEIKRQLVLSRENNKCQHCSSTTNLCIHHGTYVRLFKEELSDLYCLCSDCHTLLHKPYGTKDLLRVTKSFISGEEYIPRVTMVKEKSTKDKIKAHNQLKKWNKKKKDKKIKVYTTKVRKVKVKKRRFLPEVPPETNYSFKGVVVLKKWKLGDPR